MERRRAGARPERLWAALRAGCGRPEQALLVADRVLDRVLPAGLQELGSMRQGLETSPCRELGLRFGEVPYRVVERREVPGVERVAGEEAGERRERLLERGGEG